MKVIRGLRAGKSPKEIAFMLGVGRECVKAIIWRNLPVREVFVETHTLRYPESAGPPNKIINPLQRIAT